MPGQGCRGTFVSFTCRSSARISHGTLEKKPLVLPAGKGQNGPFEIREHSVLGNKACPQEKLTRA